MDRTPSADDPTPALAEQRAPDEPRDVVLRLTRAEAGLLRVFLPANPRKLRNMEAEHKERAIRIVQALDDARRAADGRGI